MTIRLGIIGTGIAARDLHWPALEGLKDRFEIVALANRTPEKAESFAQLIGGTPRITTDYRELLSWPDVDAVDIVVPIAMNAPLAIDSLRGGKHVIVEKPIANTVAAGRSLVEEADRHPQLVLLVAENVRYDPRYRLARTLVMDGQIGTPIMIHHDVLAPLDPDSPYIQTPWRLQPQHIGGYLSDGGVHQTAALHMLAGPVQLVQGMVTSFHPETDPTDTLLANLLFVSGARGHLTYSVGVRQHEVSPLRIYGTAGALAVDDDRVVLTTLAGRREYRVDPRPNGFDGEFADFHRAITEGLSPEATPRDTLDDLRLIDAIIRSSQDCQPVHLHGRESDS